MVHLRPEWVADVEAVARVHVRAWQAGYAGIVPDAVLAGLDPAEWARVRRDRLGSPLSADFTTTVADLDGHVIGFATVGPYRIGQDRRHLDGSAGEILAIYVDPDHWGTGVGRALMDAAIAELARRGFPEARLWVLADNARARRFYERCGLAPDGERSVYRVGGDGRTGTDLAEVRYAVKLGRPAGR